MHMICRAGIWYVAYDGKGGSRVLIFFLENIPRVADSGNTLVRSAVNHPTYDIKVLYLPTVLFFGVEIPLDISILNI